MTPLEILKNIGLTLSDFNLTTAALSSLEKWGSTWTNWTQAQALAKQLGFPSGPSGAIKAFNIGRLLGRQSEWIGAIGNLASLPRQMMQVAGQTDWSETASAKYRYDVAIDTYFSRSDTRQPLYAHVDSDVPLPSTEVIRRAQASIRGDLFGASPDLLADTGPLFSFGQAEITGIFRYT